MSDVLHKLAVYIDSEGIRRTILAESLRDPDILADAKLQALYDASEQVRVAPRAPEGVTPHFCEMPGSRANRKVYSGETDPTHNKRVQELTEQLRALKAFSLVLKGKASDGGKIKPIIKLPKYEWGAETHRILNAETMVRHDIFGQSPELGMSIRRPWIAIEVIHTHYPEEEAFAALLEVSRNLPLIVLFDLTFKDAFVTVDEVRHEIQIRPWTYYIKDGEVWKGETSTGIATAARLKIDVDDLKAWWNRS